MLKWCRNFIGVTPWLIDFKSIVYAASQKRATQKPGQTSKNHHQPKELNPQSQKNHANLVHVVVL
jgi:hypothetical protein